MNALSMSRRSFVKAAAVTAAAAAFANVPGVKALAEEENAGASAGEIKRIRTDSNEREKMQRDVKLRAARTKKEFDKLKEVYDAEFQQMNERLNAAKAVADERAKPLSQAYLDKYQTIKRHSFPPLARMIGSQCTGCNMSLPSGVVKDVQSGKEIECETCGRLLIYSE